MTGVGGVVVAAMFAAILVSDVVDIAANLAAAGFFFATVTSRNR